MVIRLCPLAATAASVFFFHVPLTPTFTIPFFVLLFDTCVHAQSAEVAPKGAVHGFDFSKKLVDALDAIKWTEDHLSSSDVRAVGLL